MKGKEKKESKREERKGKERKGRKGEKRKQRERKAVLLSGRWAVFAAHWRKKARATLSEAYRNFCPGAPGNLLVHRPGFVYCEISFSHSNAPNGPRERMPSESSVSWKRRTRPQMRWAPGHSLDVCAGAGVNSRSQSQIAFQIETPASRALEGTWVCIRS